MEEKGTFTEKVEIFEKPIKNIATALSKFQGELEAAKKDSVNPFYKSHYSDLRSVWNVIREPLAKNGLSVTQIPTVQGELGMVLITRVLHISGESIESIYPINPVKNDPQGIGSAVTYARRYALTAVLGVVSGDDDGNDANGNGEPLKAPKKKSGRPKNEDKYINEAQRIRFFAIAKKGNKTEDQIKTYLKAFLNTESSKEILKGKAYDDCCTWAQESGDAQEE